MIEGRKEKREAVRFQVQLCNLANRLVAESASTQDTSVHGLRVQTERRWEPTTRVSVKSYQRELWALARVVYCQYFYPRDLLLDWNFSPGPVHGRQAVRYGTNRYAGDVVAQQPGTLLDVSLGHFLCFSHTPQPSGVDRPGA